MHSWEIMYFLTHDFRLHFHNLKACPECQCPHVYHFADTEATFLSPRFMLTQIIMECLTLRERTFLWGMWKYVHYIQTSLAPMAAINACEDPCPLALSQRQELCHSVFTKTMADPGPPSFSFSRSCVWCHNSCGFTCATDVLGSANTLFFFISASFSFSTISSKIIS